MESLSLGVLLVIFVAAAAAIWIAGITLSNATDILSARLGIGQALGGAIFLSIVTNLPEIAITVSAAMQHNLGLAIGNILGGIAMQTVVLVVFDVFGLGKSASLTYRAASLVLVIEGTMVLAVLALVVIGNQFGTTFIFFHFSPVDVLIFATWIAGLFLINRARKNLPWHENGIPPDGQSEPRGHAMKKKDDAAKHLSTTKVVLQFTIASVITLIAGVTLELSSDAIAGDIGMSGVLFGATVLAFATSLPEISTGLQSMKLKDYQMAVSDIFGGNAFLPVLFLLATLISGESVLPQAQKTDIYLTALAGLLTIIYIFGLIFRPKKQILRMGIDSFLVLVIYILGVLGLFAVAPSP